MRFLDEINFFKELLKIYSPTGQEKKAVDFLTEKMDSFGFNTKIDKAGNAIGVIGKGTKKVLFLGHIDTVEGEIPIEEKDGKIFGRGSVDAKGPLAAFVLASSKFKDSEKIQIIICGAIDEEGLSAGVKYFIKNNPEPDLIINGEPSSWDKITIGYKGGLSIKYSVATDESHTSTNEPTAIEHSINFWNKVKKYSEEFNKEKGLFDSLQVNARKINSSNDAFTQKTDFLIKFRIPPKFNLDEFKDFLEKNSGKGKIEVLDQVSPFLAGKNNELVRAFMQAIREEKGDFSFKVKTGTTDFNFAGEAWKKPIIAYGPGDSSLDHTPNEHVQKEEFLKSIKVLQKALEKL